MTGQHLDAAGDSLTIWRADAEPVALQRLQGDATTETCIIGGGFTGLAAALRLAMAGMEVILLEAGPIGWGASGRTGGQVCTGFAPGQQPLEQALGFETAKALFDLAESGKRLITRWQQEHGFDCRLRHGWLYAAALPRHVREVEEELADLQRYGHDACRIIGRDELREEWLGTQAYHAALHDAGAGHLQPLLLCHGLARAAAAAGAHICEHAPVAGFEELDDGFRVYTPNATVRCRHLILAANAAHVRLYPPIGRYILPVVSWQIATEPLPEEVADSVLKRDVAVSDTRFVPDYFRFTHLPDGRRRFVFGSGASYAGRRLRDIAGRLRPRMLHLFPQLRKVIIEAAWSGTLAVTANRLPHAGRAGRHGHIWFAQGYSGQGVVLAPLLGHLMAGDVLEVSQGRRGDEAFELFAAIPHAPHPGGPLRTWLHAARMLWRRIRHITD